jgi:hypothetical protein
VLVGVLAGAGDRARVAGALLAQLGDERDLGVGRACELSDEPAQEGRADDTGGSGGEAAEQVALADPGGGGDRRGPAMLIRPLFAGQWCWHAAGYGYLPSWPTIA